ncbi:MAG TPA: hypothetical protein VNJ08_07125 [Bacteriovoracaceae bacterium]|nr:hypothetical protein [Bacteriovoracaceae bacterium]
MKTYILALTLSLLTTQAFATTRFLCSGKHFGKSIVLNGSIENVMDPKTGKGTVTVDGMEVADFEGTDAKVNYIFLSFKAKNARGEIIEGKITDLQSGQGLISRLVVLGFGIDYKNIVVTCAEQP